MTKPTTFRNGNTKPENQSASLRRGEFNTARGAVIAIVGVAPWLLQSLEQSLRAEWAADPSKGPLTPPTYETQPLPGTDRGEIHPHDLTTLTTDAEKAAYAAYEANVAAFLDELKERTMTMVFLNGVVDGPPADGLWERRQKFLKVNVPTDEFERHIHWVKTEVISGVDEAKDLMNAILVLSGVSAEALATAEAGFQRALGNDATSAVAGEGGGMDAHAANAGSGGGEGLGAAAV